jgi:hypothetical protein
LQRLDISSLTDQRGAQIFKQQIVKRGFWYFATILFLASSTAGGSTVTWVYSYGDEYDVRGIAACPLGGFAVVKLVSWNPAIVRVDDSGNVLWEKVYDIPRDGHVYKFRPTHDGGFVMVGSLSVAGDYQENAWIIRVDASGDILWQKELGEPLLSDGLLSVTETSDGGVLAAGGSSAFGEWSGNWLIKFTADGKIDWQKDAGQTSCLDILETADGGSIRVGGGLWNMNNGAGVCKLDGNGQVEWTKWFSLGNYICYATSVDISPMGGYVVGVRSEDYGRLMDYWVLKLDASGNIEWQKRYGTWNRDYLDRVKVVQDGYLLVGCTLNEGRGMMKVWIIKTDWGGNILWQRATFAGWTFPFAYSDVSPDGFIAVTAQSDRGGFFIQKLDADGLMGPPCDLSSEMTVEPETTSCEFHSPAETSFDTWGVAWDLGAVQRDRPCERRLICTTGPYVTGQPYYSTSIPFKVRILGMNFQQKAQVFIGNSMRPWRPRTVLPDRIVLKGEGLKAKFPKGVTVPITIINPDGGTAYTSVLR